MENNHSTNSELPSAVKLLKSTVLAIVIAGVILVTTVLPAEYGIDPSGIGEMLGLKRMGDIKTELAQERIAAESDKNAKVEQMSIAQSDAKPTNYISQKGEIKIALKANEGRELKVFMKKGDQISYEWSTDGEAVYFSAHTDSGEEFTYSEGSKNEDKGILKAFCDGRHGWWYKNRTQKPMVLTLKIEGKYADFREDY
ncbi:MAG: transmembrane anchor protein [Calditrichaeota bacterium]|nr:MAG: transmembrane anchor protein [Calditrichota bacterium]